ncbi:hypothetical protein H6B15_01500 [Gemmiger formicilis]|uniref:hypothetical protein n=1 Tax=Gemmiger formicilis TaxID=745368 RepID=UPI00195BEC07|nr:hypothetical protein [Gemmiger formicilis]MBM6715339.1 hypothetical protein [Gemmiger formicilis]
MAQPTVLFQDDFRSFSIGPLPFDREHSAMGEYHFVQQPGYTGGWYDPITNCNYRGPNWIVTACDGVHYMEQMRVRNPLTHNVCPVLTAGDEDWGDYTFRVRMRALCTTEEAGLLFRYQTSLMHYAFFLNNGKAQLYRVEKKERTLLAQCDFAYDCDTLYTLEASCCGAHLRCSVNGRLLLETQDERYATGKVALAAYMPAQYTDVLVTATPEAAAAFTARRDARAARVAEKRRLYAQPKLWKIINLENFGASRQIRFGHLTGGTDWYFVIAQHQKRVFKERYCNISCLTAVSIETGRVLWQTGEPSALAVNQDTTCDLPFQIYDINNDGIDEVIVAQDFHLKILDGRTGRELRSMPTPFNDDPADQILGIEFQKHAFDRLNVDAIRIVNVSGKDHPSDILIKDRYARLWVYDDQFNLLWKFTHNNTGHFPYAYDFNGDGKDEIFSCYNMISSDGKLVWQLPISTDHTDEIVIGRFDPDVDDDLIAIVSGWEGFMIVDKQGNIRARDINGHGQRISVANYCPDRPGLQICTTTYWENQGIVYLYDCKGREIWHQEPKCNGNVIAPVNWQGDGTELILLNGNPELGGLIDGEGDQVVRFPADGHPDMCAEVIDLTGDARDEIVLWDAKHMYIYTQDRPCTLTDREYIPLKYPHCNSSNYRGEFSFARWRRR